MNLERLGKHSNLFRFIRLPKCRDSENRKNNSDETTADDAMCAHDELCGDGARCCDYDQWGLY